MTSLLLHFNEKKAENKNWTQISKLNITQIPNFDNNKKISKEILAFQNRNEMCSDNLYYIIILFKITF